MDRNELIEAVNNAYAALNDGNNGDVRRILQEAIDACGVNKVLFVGMTVPLITDEELDNVSLVKVTLIEQVRYNGLNIDLDIEGGLVITDLSNFDEWEKHVLDGVSAYELAPIVNNPQWLMAAIIGDNPSAKMINAIKEGKIEFPDVLDEKAFITALEKGNIRSTNMKGMIAFDLDEGYDS